MELGIIIFHGLTNSFDIKSHFKEITSLLSYNLGNWSMTNELFLQVYTCESKHSLKIFNPLMIKDTKQSDN